ncbi:ABC transporter ATP-binding protein [Ferrigenium kumadai]|uniref:ABC transporter ATP-binding protein n=1 Tax=Ferrigenium kumadai TaxID=1682490 RepID=A0AAN1SZH1_9PROT|nr:ABC transporter ATP-binding protein [Ferrigenium kumadai]BBI98559.1 ABC transporter ATP-binding protein [Ferrigenium kumadai]
MDNLIEVNDLHFSYGPHKVLKGINLTIPRGKIVGIMGASGCGKSTLLSHFGGQLRPSRGSVNFMGQVIHELSNDELYKVRLKMGMMFQMSGLFTDMTVYDNMAFPLREHTDLPEELIHDLVLMKLHAVGLRNARDLMPGDLSGGMERRVALARATVTDPALIIYDEPFAGLDPISLNTIANLIRKLNDALGVSSVVVTYDLAESLKIVDYIYFIHDGIVVAQGDVSEMVNSQDSFVRQFLHAEPDGPIAFQYPSQPYPNDLNIKA